MLMFIHSLNVSWHTTKLYVVIPFHGLKSDLFRFVNEDALMQRPFDRREVEEKRLALTFVCNSIPFLTSKDFVLYRSNGTELSCVNHRGSEEHE
ncbi:hypothetical protein Trydic_g1178 [Trypoxylus dichotomus]